MSLLGAAAVSGGFGLIDSLLGFGGSLFGASSAYDASVYAADMQKRINDDNIMFQRETNDTNWKRQQQVNWQNRDWYLQDDKRDYERFLENREYQTMLQNSAHQREVDDLRAAGLNPILSANSGAAAAVPALGTSSSPQAQATQDIAPHADASGYNTAAGLRAQVGNQIKDALKDGLFGKMVRNYLDAKNTELAVEKTRNHSALTTAQIEDLRTKFDKELSLRNLDHLGKKELLAMEHDNKLALDRLGYQSRRALNEQLHNYGIDLWNSKMAHEEDMKYLDYELNSPLKVRDLDIKSQHNEAIEKLGLFIALGQGIKGAAELLQQFFPGVKFNPAKPKVPHTVPRESGRGPFASPL